MKSLHAIARENQNVLDLQPIFTIDLHIDPESPQARDDVYRLLDEEGNVLQERSVADDAQPGDRKLTLCFTGLQEGCRYSLEIDEGAEGRYFAFYRVPLEELIEADEDADDPGDAGGRDDSPEDFATAPADPDVPALSADELQPEVVGPPELGPEPDDDGTGGGGPPVG